MKNLLKATSFAIICGLAAKEGLNAHSRSVDAVTPLSSHQDVTFEHISTEHGPSTGTINCIVQDRQGLLWLGTANGLLRYDGYEFKAYKHHPADSNSISGNHVWSICEDRNGDLWVGTSGRGLNRYIRSEDSFLRYQHDPNDSTSLAGDDEVPWIHGNAAGEIWIALWEAGLDRYHRAANRFDHYRLAIKDEQGVPRSSVHRVHEDGAGLLWIGTKRGVIKLDRERNIITTYKHDPSNPRSLGGNYIYAIFEDRRGNLWIGALAGGLSRYDRDRDDFVVYRHNPDDPASLSGNSVFALAEEGNGMLWIGTDDGGLNRFDPTTGKFSHFRLESSHSPRPQRISSLLVDRTGILWIGTVGVGLYRHAPGKRKFSHYRNAPHNAGGLNSSVVDAILESQDGTLWIGTAGGGLHRHDPDTGELTHNYLNDPANPNSLSHNFVSALYEDERGSLWVGTYGGGLNRFHEQKQTFKRYLHDPDNPRSLPSNLVTSLLADSRGNLWIATDGTGVCRYDPENDSFVHGGPDGGTDLNSAHVFAQYEDRRGDLWFGTWGSGVTRFDVATGTFTVHQHDPGDPSTISGYRVISIAEDNRGNLWFGTWGEGLNRYDRASNTFTRYTSAEGLPNNIVHGILPDDEGNLWISSNNGLAKLDPESGAWKTYNPSDGVQAAEFRRGACHKGRSGRLFFGGVNGFNAFYPAQISDNPHVPAIVVTSFRIFDREIPLPMKNGETGAQRELRLSHRDNYFSFEFAALAYTAPEKNQYAYQMEGFDENWIHCGARRYASYTNLDPGEYVFRVKGSNHDGVWNERGAAIKLIISPPFWQRWWFRTLMAVSIVLIAYGAYRLRVAKPLEIERLRVRIASDLHDEVGSTLTKISLYSDLIQTGTEPETTQNMLQKIGAMSRELVTTMSDIVWSIDARNDTVGDLIDRMRDFAISACSPRNISVRFDASGLEAGNKLSADIRQNIYLIFKEAVNNAAKHAKASRLSIKLLNLNSSFKMSIEDDGQGPGEESRTTGQGLRNMKMRAERIGARLEVKMNGGVSVTFECHAL